MIENALASRIKLDKKNEIQSEIILFESAELRMDVKRLLYHEKAKNEPYISVKMQLDSIHVKNFNEKNKIRNKTIFLYLVSIS